jgi:integrase
VKQAVKTHLEAQGWAVTVAWGRERGIDIEATKRRERLVIEAKGEVARGGAQQVSYFLGVPCRFHDLRHSHAALLTAAGRHPKVIQERLGHTSIRTTLDVYRHLLEGLDRGAADALDDLVENWRVGLAWG